MARDNRFFSRGSRVCLHASPHCVDEVCATPLSRRTTKCWLTQWGLECQQAREPWEKNWLSLALWYSPSDCIGDLIVIGSSLCMAV